MANGIDEKDLYDQGIKDYQEACQFLKKDYPELAKIADLVSEECLRRMSRGTLGVMKGQMYPIVFEIVFLDLVRMNAI
jgi:hypothetical protein